MKVYFFPIVRKKKNNELLNPYGINLMQSLNNHCDVVNINSIERISSVFNLFKYSSRADHYLFNWPDDIPFSKIGWLQSLMFILLLRYIKKRKSSIIWIFHNFQNHRAENFFTQLIRKNMFKLSNYIITHSSEANIYLMNNFNKERVYFFSHPVKIAKFSVDITKAICSPNFDILIWGSISPYKGTVEFLKYLMDSNLNNSFSIKIVGKCSDKKYADRIQYYCNDWISFENRTPSFDELRMLNQDARFTVFPYIGASISSSGALIDTLAFGGNPVGPNRGAFKDLNEEEVCFVYSNYDEMIEILRSDKKIYEKNRIKFIKDNSWETFASKIHKILSCSLEIFP